MNTQLKSVFICVSIFTLISVSCIQNTEINTTIFNTKKISRVSALEDLDQYINFIKQTHPRIGYTADENHLDSAVKTIRQKITDSLSIQEIWDLFASLNPIFNDAHVGLIAPENVYEEFLSSGGFKMPFSVKINNSFILLNDVNSDLYDKYSDYKILSINDIETKTILSRLLPKMRGESRSLQELILSKRFHIFFTMYYGNFKEYVLELSDVHGNIELITIAPKEAGLKDPNLNYNKENYYAFERVSDSIAYLKISSFDIENKDIFEKYLENSFTEILANNIPNLIIDIGENGGGARDLSDLLLNYLTTEKYTPTSKVEARVTNENKKLIPNAELGEVVTVPYPSWVIPENKIKVFNGNVYVLLSEKSYSQAIVFATIVQDFNLGKIVGEETAGKANQTGQVQKTQLNNTGFTVYCPIYIFSRAKVIDESRGVIPDVEIDYSKAKEKVLSILANK